MRLEINYMEKNVKNTNTWRINDALLNNQEITEEIKEEIKKYLETNDNDPKLMGCSKSSSKREVYGNTILPQKQEKSLMNNLPLHLKELEKEEQTNPKVSRRKEIIKIRAEMNELETKKTIAKINKTKSWLFEKLTKLINL